MYVASNLTQTAAANLQVDTTFNATYTGPVYAQPLFVDGGAGGRDMLFVVTEQNQVLAFDGSNGQMIWQRTVATPQAVPLPGLPTSCGNIRPNLGITGTPVIDSQGRTIFFDAMVSGPHHQIFALSIDDGSPRAGWPVDVATVHMGSLQFAPLAQNQRGALALLNGNLYVPYGGHAGDCGNYHGWVVSVPVNNPGTPTGWATIDQEAGIWAPGGLSSDGTSIFAVTGNGQGGTTWGNGEMVVRLGAGATFSDNGADYWFPMDWQTLDAGDTDLGGSGAIVFDLPGSAPSALLAAFGKDGKVYLIDRQNMGGVVPAGSAPVASISAANAEIINASVFYTTPNGSYVAFATHSATSMNCNVTGATLVAVKINPGSPPTMQFAWCAAPGGRGSPMVTTTDGTNNPIVWAFSTNESGTNTNHLRGYNGDTGQQIYDSGNVMNSIHRFSTPIVAKGRIFVAADGQLYAFKTN